MNDSLKIFIPKKELEFLVESSYFYFIRRSGSFHVICLCTNKVDFEYIVQFSQLPCFDLLSVYCSKRGMFIIYVYI